MAKINWTLEAELSLREIYDYTVEKNPVAAERLLDGILAKADLLASFPEIGARREHPHHHIRILLYGHFKIPYLIKPDSNIDILGVFHSAMDTDRFFREL